MGFTKRNWLETLLSLLPGSSFSVLGYFFKHHQDMFFAIALALFFVAGFYISVLIKLDTINKIITKNTGILTVDEFNEEINLEQRFQKFKQEVEVKSALIDNFDQRLVRLNDRAYQDLDLHRKSLAELYAALKELEPLVTGYHPVLNNPDQREHAVCHSTITQTEINQIKKYDA